VCLTTGQVFESQAAAAKECNIDTSSIAKGSYKTAGKHSVTGESLTWMYYDKSCTANAI